jgi:hypothetical protein
MRSKRGECQERIISMGGRKAVAGHHPEMKWTRFAYRRFQPRPIERTGGEVQKLTEGMGGVPPFPFFQGRGRSSAVAMRSKRGECQERIISMAGRKAEAISRRSALPYS